MAESLAEKLKRLAAEKKALAASSPTPVVVEVEKTASDRPVDPEVFVENSETNLEARFEIAEQQMIQAREELPANLQPTPSSHPLAMQFAEMEAALLATDPSFKTILRDVHRHLGQDPDLVTLMTEAEVALVVKGLVTFANAEIVVPAKAKAVKAASKKAISADDL